MVTSTEDGLQGEAFPRRWSHEEGGFLSRPYELSCSPAGRVYLTLGSSSPGVTVPSGRPPSTQQNLQHPAKAPLLPGNLPRLPGQRWTPNPDIYQAVLEGLWQRISSPGRRLLMGREASGPGLRFKAPEFQDQGPKVS